MKQDIDWNVASTSYDPLDLYQLMEKMMLVQMEDRYPFATVCDQERGFYLFRQETMSNPQWYEKFNTKVDVGSAIGITQQHKVLLEYVRSTWLKKTTLWLSWHYQQRKNKWSTRTPLKSITSHKPSYVRAEPNMVISRWI
jgi:hypothetical protein